MLAECLYKNWLSRCIDGVPRVVIVVFRFLIYTLLTSFLIFILVSKAGNPFSSDIYFSATLDEVLSVKQKLGYDQPLIIQYYDFIKALLAGGGPLSYAYQVPAVSVILERIPATLELFFLSLIVVCVAGIWGGVYIGMNPKGFLQRILYTGTTLVLSIPTFWLGIFLVMLLSVSLPFFPSLGRGETRSVSGGEWGVLTLSGWHALVLPVITASMSKTAYVARVIALHVQQLKQKSFYRFALARGLPPHIILKRYILKNLAIPSFSLLPMEAAKLLFHSVVTEVVFSWPGLGVLMVEAVQSHDRPLIVLLSFFIYLFVLMFNMVSDTILWFILRKNNKEQAF